MYDIAVAAVLRRTRLHDVGIFPNRTSVCRVSYGNGSNLNSEWVKLGRMIRDRRLVHESPMSQHGRAADAGKSGKRAARSGDEAAPLRLPGVCAFALIGLSAVAKACKAAGTTSERLGRLSEDLALSLLAFGPAATRAGALPLRMNSSPGSPGFKPPLSCSALACPEMSFSTRGRFFGGPGYAAARDCTETCIQELLHTCLRGCESLMKTSRCRTVVPRPRLSYPHHAVCSSVGSSA